MHSLGIMISLLLVPLLLTPWILARTARAVGSPRGRMNFGVLATAIILVIEAMFAFIRIRSQTSDLPSRMAILLFLMILELGVTFVVFRRVFQLTGWRTFAPFGALIAFTVVQFVLAVTLVRPFIIEAFVVPTASMAPTIEPGDRIVANKLIHPRRWDVVAYWNTGPERAVWCKRVIGLPGERLRFEGGNITINDQPVIAPRVIAGRCHASIPGVTGGAFHYRDGETIVLGANQYFFMGDNVNLSADSRIKGPTDGSLLVGVIDLAYWPLSRARIMR